MGISLDGLASGLDTTALIANLMKVESQPKLLLQRQVANVNARLTDFQTLNTRIAALAEAAANGAKPGAAARYTAAASSDAVSVVAKEGAATSALDLVVAQLAERQVQVTGALASWPDAPPVLTIVRADGTRVEISPASDSIADVAKAVNAAGAGVTATRVASGTDANGQPQYRLQFASTETGAEAAFTVYRGSASDVDAGLAVDLADEPGASLIRTARDAEVVLWAGTPSEQRITSASNTFAELMPGIDVTVAKPTSEAVSITVAPDGEATAKLVDSLLGGLRDILAFMQAKAATAPSKDADGNPITALGTFTSDVTIRTIQQQLQDAVQRPVDGVSPASIGISFTKDGVLEFDAAKFQAALADDLEGTMGFFEQIAGRVAETATAVSDKFDGTLTRKITGQLSLVTSLDRQVDSWTHRLEQREANLRRTYAALEVALSTLNSQSDYLASQLKGLPGWGGDSSK